MIELFNEIPQEVRDRTKFWFEVSLSQPHASDSIQMLEEYKNSCTNEYEKEFIEFYISMRMEQLMRGE